MKETVQKYLENGRIVPSKKKSSLEPTYCLYAKGMVAFMHVC
jgi:hypothetical protein